jgi:ArsR family transcriptional regulator
MDDTRLVRALKALSDPKRFRMVQVVASAGELSCGRIGAEFALTQPTISHHLKILTEAHLLLMRREGQHAYARVNRELIEALRDLPDRLAPARRAPPLSGRQAGPGSRRRRADVKERTRVRD